MDRTVPLIAAYGREMPMMEAGTGFEPVNAGFANRCVSDVTPDESGTCDEGSPRLGAPLGTEESDGSQSASDPDLALVIQAWPTLPPALRAGIAAMVSDARAHDASEGGRR